MVQPEELFGVDVTDGPDAPVLTLFGELDVATAPALRSAIDLALADGPRDLVFNLRDLEFIDSTGLGVIASVLRQLAPAGRRLILREAQPKTRKVLELTGMSGLFDLER